MSEFGFRFYATDALILAAGTAAAWTMHQQNFPLWWIVPCALGHFFLFCNVFRVRRSFELAWAMVFLINVGGWMNQGSFEWLPSTLCQLPVTIGVLITELISPRYHGILARQINPALDRYLASRTRA